MTKKDFSRPALARELLLFSQDDIEAARLLHDDGLYGLAVYHFQQAVEKACKVNLVLASSSWAPMGSVFGHDSLAKVEETEIVSRHFWSLFDTETSLTELMDRQLDGSLVMISQPIFFSLYLTSQDDISYIAGISERDIIALLEEADRSFLKHEEAMHKDFFREIPAAKTIDELRDHWDDLYWGLKIVKAMIFLRVAALVSNPHNTSTRYPVQTLSRERYTGELGIVRAMPELLGRLSETVNSYKEEVEAMTSELRKMENMSREEELELLARSAWRLDSRSQP
jgi:hypothetical protein